MEKECIFCKWKEDKSKILFSSRYFYAVYDGYPVSPGHLLLISKRHVETYDKLYSKEKINLIDCINKGLYHLKKNFSLNLTQTDEIGYNIGINSGKVAGQTMMHFHCHLIPRVKGDTEDPKGGVRGVIPEKQKY